MKQVAQSSLSKVLFVVPFARSDDRLNLLDDYHDSHVHESQTNPHPTFGRLRQYDVPFSSG